MALRSSSATRGMNEGMRRRDSDYNVNVNGGGKAAMGAGVLAAIVAFAFLAIGFALTWSMVTDDVWRWIILVILIIAGIVIILWFLWLLFSGLSGAC